MRGELKVCPRRYYDGEDCSVSEVENASNEQFFHF